MGLLEFMAMRALYQRRSGRLEIRIPRIRSLLGLFRLGYRHLVSPLFYVFRSVSVFDL